MNNRHPHFLLAPDSFKDSLAAPEICKAMAEGIRRIVPDARITSMPLSDGGEGFVTAMAMASEGEIYTAEVTGPLHTPVDARYALTGNRQNTAVIEMAEASGLQRIPESHRNPLVTSTYGTGELIQIALVHPVERLLVGIGGSSTHDLGCGLAQALGIRFFDENGEIRRPVCGELLRTVRSIDMQGLDSRLKHVDILVACDVTNPLLGPQGAAHTYARQKGADDQAVIQLERDSAYIIGLMESATGKQVRDLSGAGAGGGLGAGLLAFLDADLRPGIELMMDITHFRSLLNDVDYILTGEGRTDAQTLHGKTVWGVIQQAKSHRVPVIILSGRIDPAAAELDHHGVHAMISISPPNVPISTAMKNTGPNLVQATEAVIRQILESHP